MAVKNSVTRKSQNTIQNMIIKQKEQIAKALPKVITPERFTRIALTAVNANPTLAKCDSMTLLAALMQSAQLGLEPNTPLGQAYLIPYGGKCQFQIGYRGLLDLAYRSGEFKNIYAETVYENDTFEYELGLSPRLKHIPSISNRGKPIFYYAVFNLVNGGYGFKVMSYDDVVAHRKKYSKAGNSPWNTEFDAMAKKTVLKQALKYAPIKSDVVAAANSDESVKSDITEDMSTVSRDAIDIDIQEVPEKPADANEPVSVDEETGEVYL